MKTIQQKYFQICNGLYKPMGFIRIGRTYLRLLNKRVGLLVNFSSNNIREGIRRIAN